MTEWNGIQLAGLELRSARLVLRPWQAADAAAVAEIMRDPRMMEYLPLPNPYTAADAAEFVEAVAADRTGSLELAMVRDGRLVGAVAWFCRSATTAPRSATGCAATPGAAATPPKRCARWPGSPSSTASSGSESRSTSATSPRPGWRCGPASASRASPGWAAGASKGWPTTPSSPGWPRTRTPRCLPSWPELTELTDGVLLLRKPRPDDWPTLYAEGSNPESLRWGFGGEYTEQAAVQRAEAAGMNWLIGRSADLVICDVATGAAAGTMNLRWVGPPDVVGIGYGIVPEFRGRRFTSRALRLLADWAFSQTSIVRLELGCKVDNVASARSAELAGFVRDGRFASRLRNPDGSYSDEIGFGLVRGGRPPG